MYNFTIKGSNELKNELISNILTCAKHSGSPNGSTGYDRKELTELINTVQNLNIGVILDSVIAGNGSTPGHCIIYAGDVLTKEAVEQLEQVAVRAKLVRRFNLKYDTNKDDVISYIDTGVITDSLKPYLYWDRSKTVIYRKNGYLAVSDGTYELDFKLNDALLNLVGIMRWVNDSGTITVLHSGKAIKLKDI